MVILPRRCLDWWSHRHWRKARGGVFTVGATIPIAMFMGGYLRFWRVGRVMEVHRAGRSTLLFLAVWGGKYAHENPAVSQLLTLRAPTLAWAIIIYGLAASLLPIWLLLAPRDYLSTFMKLGTIFALALGIFVMLPDLKMPAVTAIRLQWPGARAQGKNYFRSASSRSPAACLRVPHAHRQRHRAPRSSRGKVMRGPSVTAPCAWNRSSPSWP